MALVGESAHDCISSVTDMVDEAFQLFSVDGNINLRQLQAVFVYSFGMKPSLRALRSLLEEIGFNQARGGGDDGHVPVSTLSKAGYSVVMQHYIARCGTIPLDDGPAGALAQGSSSIKVPLSSSLHPLQRVHVAHTAQAISLCGMGLSGIVSVDPRKDQGQGRQRGRAVGPASDRGYVEARDLVSAVRAVERQAGVGPVMDAEALEALFVALQRDVDVAGPVTRLDLARAFAAAQDKGQRAGAMVSPPRAVIGPPTAVAATPAGREGAEGAGAPAAAPTVLAPALDWGRAGRESGRIRLLAAQTLAGRPARPAARPLDPDTDPT